MGMRSRICRYIYIYIYILRYNVRQTVEKRSFIWSCLEIVACAVTQTCVLSLQVTTM